MMALVKNFTSPICFASDSARACCDRVRVSCDELAKIRSMAAPVATAFVGSSMRR